MINVSISYSKRHHPRRQEGYDCPMAGRRKGVSAVDRLNFVAHDKLMDIIDEANRPESAIHLQTLIPGEKQLQQKPVTVVSQSKLDR